MFDLGRVEITIMNTIFHSCLMSKHIPCLEQHVQSFRMCIIFDHQRQHGGT